MIGVILGMLANPKFLAAGGALIAQLIGQFGFHADPTQLTTALSPLYLYVLAQAHSESGHTSASPSVTPTAALTPINPSNIAKAASAAVLLGVFALALGFFVACSGPQKQAERAAVICTAKDIDALIAIGDDKTTNGAQKFIAFAANAALVEACLEASKPPAAAAPAAAK